ncbi:hypothetical protein O3M35_010031 [Rhynocoris fuscipes]|uniref:RAI1-like domain-containing protein n=1 Tax=Rhynocoris fuscipes TaxID=488301 RepID=A0AAW1D123_9HEMI
MESKLEIVDWKEDLVPVIESKPELIDYFVTKYNQTDIFDNFNELKYLDAKASFNVDNVNSKFDKDKLNPVKESFDFLSTFSSSRNYANTTGTQIVTYANVLSTIMNTPFEINKEKRKWNLTARYCSNKILLYSDNNQISANKPENLYNTLLKKHFFIRKPQRYYRRIVSNFDNLCYEVYRFNLSDNSVIYLADNPGIMTENTINNLDELKEAEHGICDVCVKDEISEDIMNYNPNTWSKAALINAKHCIVGVYNKDNNNLEELTKFSSDLFNDKTKYENLWSPNAAWNFLDFFLTFVNIMANKYANRNDMLLEFKSYPNDKPYVSCESYRRYIDYRGIYAKCALTHEYMHR